MHRLHETRASVRHGERLGNDRRLHEDDRRRCHPRSDSPDDREGTDTGVVQPLWSSRAATLGSRRELRELRHQTPLRPLRHQEVANDTVPSPGQCSNGAIQPNTSRSTAEPLDRVEGEVDRTPPARRRRVQRHASCHHRVQPVLFDVRAPRQTASRHVVRGTGSERRRTVGDAAPATTAGGVRGGEPSPEASGRGEEEDL